MIGNDIIDLQQCNAESNWRRKGWMEKIFSSPERDAIAHAEDPVFLVWLFWSMKESAYKVWNRQSRVTAFNPSKFHCSITLLNEGMVNGNVQYQDTLYYTHSVCTKSYIHTIAARQDNLNQAKVSVHNSIRPLADTIRPLEFFKDKDGIPFLHDRESGTIVDVSISHHGRFQAYAFFDIQDKSPIVNNGNKGNTKY